MELGDRADDRQFQFQSQSGAVVGAGAVCAGEALPRAREERGRQPAPSSSTWISTLDPTSREVISTSPAA
jgi:hypothetical protein